MDKMTHFYDLTHNNEKSITFKIKNIDVSIVNSIRRLIYTDIPNVGFYFKIKDHFVENDMNFIENKSPLHNEFLAHRLSLIPLHFTEQEIENWNRDDYKFVLKKELTSNQDIQDVTTEHFSIFDKDGKELPKSFVKRILPPNEITKDHILITKLRPENNEKKSVHIEAYATKGIAIDCTCWSVVSTCVYFNTIDEEAADVALKKLLKNIPSEKKKSVEAEFNTLQKYRYFTKNEFNEPSSFTMTVESECAMSPKFIFHKAGQVCIDKLNTIIEQFRNPKEKTVTIDNIGEIANYYVVTIKGYTHTIGNLLQSLILNKYIREKKVLEYIGYSVPHPLENTFLVKIKFINDTSMNELREFMINAIDEIVQDLTSFMKEFEEFSS